MFAQYFGQFLLNKGLVTAVSLQHALNALQETRVKLGVLALSRGWMSAEQVAQVHQAQTRQDKRFGEIAVELGYLKEKAVEELLREQASAHLLLGQALIDQEILTFETFQSALERYKQDYSLSDEQFALIASGELEVLLDTVLFNNDIKHSSASKDYITLFAKNFIRFIDSDIRLELISTGESAKLLWTASQTLINKATGAGCSTALTGTESSFLQLASRYAQEAIALPDEMMQSSVGEFLNLHNGIYLVNLSNKGVELEMDPQQVAPGSTKPAANNIISIRLISPAIDVTISFQDLSVLTASA